MITGLITTASTTTSCPSCVTGQSRTQQTVWRLWPAAFVVTPDEIDFSAKLLAANPATSVPVIIQKGFAISTLQPNSAMPASPLNPFAEMNPEQAFTLSISKPSNPGVNFHRVTDVVPAIEYEASLV